VINAELEQEDRPNQGFVEWRVVGAASSGQFGESQLNADAVNTYWRPVQECAAGAD
jgi:hypothetical protein